MGRRSEKIFFQGRHTDGQPIWEKILNIINCRENANESHHEI